MDIGKDLVAASATPLILAIIAEEDTYGYAILKDVEPDGPLRFVEHFSQAGKAVLESACRMDLEGVVSKRLDAPYRSGRSDTWLKAKCGGGQEVIIAGYATTKGAFRSLIAAVRRDGELVHVGRIGTGYGKAVVDRILPKLKALETDASPFGKGGPKGGKDVHWLKPELVAEINFAGWTGDGHLRHASFKGLREDKPAEEVVRETPAKGKAAPKPKAPDNVVLGVSLSNPDKALWPRAGKEPAVTKLDLARYLEAVADQMLPHIKGRPCSVIRTPDGIEGKQRFFQRHAGAGTSSLITLVDVKGDKQPYLRFDSAEALIAGAQSGATEFHPWNGAPNDIEYAGRLVFDLDPDPTVDFAAVVEASKAVRDRLEALGLNCFLKTTGGKGLHVVTPLKTDGRSKVPWPEAKAFAREVCARMAADEPDRYTIVLSKKARGGRIFLDYLRNDRTSTAVAPYSPRARPGATVSMPIAWTQATKALDRGLAAFAARNKAYHRHAGQGRRRAAHDHSHSPRHCIRSRFDDSLRPPARSISRQSGSGRGPQGSRNDESVHGRRRSQIRDAPPRLRSASHVPPTP